MSKSKQAQRGSGQNMRSLRAKQRSVGREMGDVAREDAPLWFIPVELSWACRRVRDAVARTDEAEDPPTGRSTPKTGR